MERINPVLPIRSKITITPLNLEEPLLIQLITDDNPTRCRNMVNSRSEWSDTGDTASMRDSRWPILNHIGALCKAFEIYDCDNAECVKNKEALNLIVPRGRWTPFREWIIQTVACQKSCPLSEQDDKPFSYLVTVINSFFWLLDSTERDKKISIKDEYIKNDGMQPKQSIELFPIFETIHWAIAVQMHMGRGPSLFGEGWKKSFIPNKVSAPAVAAAMKKASNYLCLYRVWNLTMATDRGEQDLPAVIDLAEQHEQFRHIDHESCTVDFCKYTSLDATRLRQLHKCNEPEVCRTNKLHFGQSSLKAPIEHGGRAIWSVNEPFEILDAPQNLQNQQQGQGLQEVPYITISHVWSDGTGVGLSPAGQVNSCLFNYFARMARRLDCAAIWWDTISIPLEPRLRKVAINKMHDHYSHAKCTLLHDRYLTEFEWADDGSPCLAVILSTWFTRGWAAVECMMSKTIKVIFKKPGSVNEQVIKDLDDDILAKDPSQCSRAHWIASHMIRRLRSREISNISDLVAILKPRSTSWDRDRMIILGLLAGIEVDYAMAPATITMNICKKFRNLSFGSLLHDKATISEKDGWSWCPTYLYDMPASQSSEFEEWNRFKNCIVHETGAIEAQAWGRRVTREDVVGHRIIPCAAHPYIVLKINSTLEEEWNNCLLLGPTPGPYLLVATIGQNQPVASTASELNLHRNANYLLCRYLGAVHVLGSEKNSAKSMARLKISVVKIMIGLTDPPPVQTMETFPLAQKNIFSDDLQGIEFLRDRVWIGDRDVGDILVPRNTNAKKTPGDDDSVLSLYTLQVQEDPTHGHFTISLSANPCFEISEQGIIKNVRQAWSLEVPHFGRVDLGKHWPPMSIPSNERIKCRRRRVDVAGFEDYFSEGIFTLELPEDVFTYAGIAEEQLKPTENYPYQGIWACRNLYLPTTS
ncbi:hypothetical protein ABW20_dc0104203 [Dactylellina cionopaga]|nr:hypothetical protein ABW20_dc0104203 [Dactylellina cionopaga]